MPLGYLSLGSNLGDRRENLERALRALTDAGVMTVVRRSSVYETAPQNLEDQPWFLNMVLAAETNRLPTELLVLAQAVERQLGRDREAGIRFGPRQIDIDILLFDGLVVNTPALTIPHPRMLQRRFVLEPLLEIAPDLRDPSTGRLLSEYLPAVQDQPLERI